MGCAAGIVDNPTGLISRRPQRGNDTGDERLRQPRRDPGAVQRTYTYGHELISQRQAGYVSFYGYDGLGSVRLLTNASGAMTDRYDYDAFGNLIASSGSTPNPYRFTGEQFDTNLGLYYLRARYYTMGVGRFWSRDSLDVNPNDPQERV